MSALSRFLTPIPALPRERQLFTGAAGVAWPTTISWWFAAVAMTVLCMNAKNDVYLSPRLALEQLPALIRRCGLETCSN